MKIQEYAFVFKMDHVKYMKVGKWQEEEKTGLKVGDMHSTYYSTYYKDGRV